MFDRTQADLNWENPRVREEIFNVVNFWMDKGVKGFRLDVINLISKPDLFENDKDGDGRCYYTDGPKIHQFLKDLNEETFGKDEEVMTVGKCHQRPLTIASNIHLQMKRSYPWYSVSII